MKTMKNSFVRRVVLLLTFALLFTLVAATAVLAGDPNPTLVFTFNPDECAVVLEYSGAQEPIQMEPDVPVEIPYGARVTVTVKSNTGYRIADIQNADNGNSIKQPNSLTDNEAVYQVASFLSSLRGVVLCETSVFDVVFETGEVLYQPVSGNMAELIGLKYYYKTPEGQSPTVLPEVMRDGYTFDHWQVIKASDGSEVQKIVKDENGKYQIPEAIISDEMLISGKIYLHAVFVPVTYEVIRHDKAYDIGAETTIKHLGTYVGQMPMDAIVSALTQMGDDGESTDPENPYLNYKSYIGYKLYVDGDYPEKHITIPTESTNPNTFERWYLPIVYALDYQLTGGTLPEGAPTSYTYDAYTTILQPTRRGYQFMGWRVFVDGVMVAETGKDFVLGNEGENNTKYAAKDEKIVLEAIWQAEKYNITYNWGTSADLITNKNDLLGSYGSFEFDKVTFIPNPVRAGYTFKGWTLTYTNGDATPDNVGLAAATGGYNLDGSLHAQEITLTAAWEVEVYNVILGGQEDAPEGYTTAIPGVQYDAPLSIPGGAVIVPAREGYTFDGYWSAPNGGKQYIDKDGNSVCNLWDLDGENGSVTLYAKWVINQYSITVDPIQKIPASKAESVIITVYVNNVPTIYTEPMKLDYKTEFYVVITLPVGFEIVAWNVDSFTPNGNVFTSSNLVVGAEDMTLTAQARPSAPVLGGDVKSIRPISDTEIKVLFADATIATLYEVAISLDSDVANLAADAWKSIADGQDHYVFGDLQPGTHYYVFVRLKETADALSGIALSEKKLTEYDEYVEEMVDRLNGMITNDDGDIAKGVIANTIKEIDKLREDPDAIPENFYQLVQDLIDGVEEKLIFARLQDSKIAALQNHREECMASGSFSPENKALLNSLCADAVAEISGATTEEDVDAIYNTAKAAMQAVPVTHLYDANGFMQLTSQLGLAQNSGITLSSIEDIKALRRAIADAIAKGNITADSFITIEEATKLLRALDTVSAYSFNLINVQAGAGDVFTLRLTIPESLAGCTGLQVAYFNQATGMLELLETTIEGNTLVFKAKQIADFVILADPTVDLTAVIIALGAILLCQLIAIVLVLVSRNKAKNSVMHASVALPLFLTIHFLPVANAELIALGLGIAVILAQIVLMWLLVSSGMIRVFKTRKTAPAQQEVTAVVREEDLQEDPYTAFDEEASDEETVDEEAVDEEVPEEEVVGEAPAKEMLDDDAFDEELAEELAREQEEEFADDEQVVEEELHEETEEVYDDEEFIEHAPNPYYSLDEEENEYAFDEEETERVSDVDTTDQEAEETSFGDDPLDGVFGGAGGQDGIADDEAGYPRYADAYAEPYEYGDEADAPYAETEDAYREETSGEGSIDATAYIVNDDEDLSDEEEMYRYDE